MLPSDLPQERSEQFFRKVLETVSDGLFLVSPQGTIAMVNPALCQLLGYTAAELVGQPCTVLKCDACARSRAEGGAHWCRLFDVRREHRRTCRLVRKDGTLVTVLKNAALIEEDGRILGGVETLTDISQLERCEETIRDLRRRLDDDHTFQGMIGASAVMRRTFGLIEKAAASDAPVIILGESGTGKELVARAIHNLSPRRQQPYIQCNCAALNESLLESELFGHAKGAFTGAYRHRQGRFEAAHGGSIFLDEIGDMPLSTQVKLLRVLETKHFERVGEHRSMAADVRIITATNRDLDRLVAEGRFREDFSFRIRVIPIHLPPLRDRTEDIPLLAEAFAARLRQSSGKALGLSPEALELLLAHAWPGNVRELRSALEYAFVVAEAGAILPEHLPPSVTRRSAPAERPAGTEREALLEALRRAGGNKSEAARILGVSRLTVLNRMRRHGVELARVLKG